MTDDVLEEAKDLYAEEKNAELVLELVKIMKFVIKHQSNSRVRLELPFTCPHPVQMYLEELACTVPGIEKLHFYKDLKHVGVYFTQGKVQQVQRFLSLIQMENVIENKKKSSG